MKLSENTFYRKIKAQSDRVSESILNRSRIKNSVILSHFINEIYPYVFFQNKFALDKIVSKYAYHFSNELFLLKKKIYVLNYISETIVLSILKNEKEIKIDKIDFSHLKKNFNEEDIVKRYALSLNRIVRKALDAYELGLVLDESQEELEERVRDSFPRLKSIKQKKDLRRISEANISVENKLNIMLGEELDEIWRTLVHEYRSEALVWDRLTQNDFSNVKKFQNTLDWQDEKEITNEFVSMVNQGSIEAANQMGVKDFVWISVIDDKTDECCALRDGVLLSRIKEKIEEEGEIGECDAVVPPAHFGCRCRIAPVDDEILDEIPSSNKIDFEDWLES